MNKHRHGGNKSPKFALHTETLRRLNRDELGKVGGGQYTSGNSTHYPPGGSVCDPCQIEPLCG